MNNSEYEREIDIIDMLKECLKRWWIILAMAIVGVIVGGAVSLYISSSQVTTEVIIEEELSEKEISLCDAYIEAKEKMDSVSISEIETNEELDYYYSLKKSLINDYDKFTDQQKEYIAGEKDTIEINTTDEISTTGEMRFHKTLKVAILGLFVGIVVPVMVICLIYIFSGTIKTQEDMLLYSMNNYYNADKDYMKSLLENVCRNNKVSNLGIVGEDDFARQIDLDYFNTENLKICYLGNPVISTEAIRGINSMDGVMCIAKLKTTSNKDVIKNIQIIKDAGVKVVGCILIP